MPLELSEAMKRLQERADNPQDLNDALLAVLAEQYAHELAEAVGNRHHAKVYQALGLIIAITHEEPR